MKDPYKNRWLVLSFSPHEDEVFYDLVLTADKEATAAFIRDVRGDYARVAEIQPLSEVVKWVKSLTQITPEELVDSMASLTHVAEVNREDRAEEAAEHGNHDTDPVVIE